MEKKKIAVVVPTIRGKDQLVAFINDWQQLFKLHDVKLVIVKDGDKPIVYEWKHTAIKYTARQVLGKDADLISNHTDACRNLGFAYVAKFMPEIEVILTLDDDTKPHGDTIKHHLEALSVRAPITWMNTTMTQYMRGFPYNIRGEAPVVVSHGVWEGVPDLDAASQLQGISKQTFYRGVIPKGALFPMCGMNVAFHISVLPYMYFAPMMGTVQRFADIWCGIEMKKDMDARNLAVVTGMAAVLHERASNVYKNLQLEAKGIEMNDHYGRGLYFKEFFEKRKRWREFILKCT